MKFAKEFLQDMGGETIYDKIDDSSRWSITHERVFKHENKFYRTYYNVGATEMQDESPYEWGKSEIECAEVIPIERTVVVYEEK